MQLRRSDEINLFRVPRLAVNIQENWRDNTDKLCGTRYFRRDWKTDRSTFPEMNSAFGTTGTAASIVEWKTFPWQFPTVTFCVTKTSMEQFVIRKANDTGILVGITLRKKREAVNASLLESARWEIKRRNKKYERLRLAKNGNSYSRGQINVVKIDISEDILISSL